MEQAPQAPQAPQSPPAHELHPLGRQPEPESTVPWIAMGAGAALLALVVVGFILFSRSDQPAGSGQPHPYAANLKFTDLKLSAAENFVGGNVTYLDGQLTNTGDQTVNGATVELVFRNTLNEVVQKETMPVRVLSQAGPYPDVVDLRAAPLAPGKSRPIRLTLEHISADWNRAAPDIKVTNVSFQ
ncbi:MAG: DUF2393 domain-containing protein [Acidobacteriota bacterium]|nr:DUF2393 domain-containing protein [Acidobacteriota bacterium]